MKPRILLDCRPLYNGHRLRGIGYVVKHLIPELVAIQSYEFVFLTYKNTNPSLDLGLPPTIETWYTNRPFFKERFEWLWDIIGLFRVYQGKKPVVLSHFFSLTWGIGIGKIFLTVNDIFPFIDKRYSRPFDQGLRWFILKHLVGYAKGVVAISNATADSISRFYRNRFGTIPVSYLAVDGAFSPVSITEKAVIKKTLDLPEHYILYAGGVDNLDPRKNIPLLLNSFLEINRQYPDVSLVIVGKSRGKTKQLIEEFCQRNNITGKIIIPGFVSDEVYINYFQVATLYLHVSQAEGFGLPLLQSLSVGLPVVALQNTSVQEVVGDAGILVSNEVQLPNVVVKLFANGNEYQVLQEKALKQAQKFNWAMSRAIYETAYNRAIQSNNFK